MSNVKTLEWVKFYPRNFTADMLGHRNEYIGMWAKIWSKLAGNEERWVKNASINEWAAIIGENTKTTKICMNWVQASVPNITVKSLFEGNESRYEITDEWYLREEATRKSNANRTEKSRKDSPLAFARKELYQQIWDIYPHHRRVTTNAAAVIAFNKILIRSSKTIRGTSEKIAQERAICQLIYDYVKHIKGSNSWTEDEMRFVPGIARFLQSRAWETDETFKETVRDLDKNHIVALAIGDCDETI